MVEMMSWKEAIEIEMEVHADSWENGESVVVRDGGDIETRFDSSEGKTEGKPFCVWTRDRVYFPLTYNGMEAVGSVSRNPDQRPVVHLTA